jgi:hypothetical protein
MRVARIVAGAQFYCMDVVAFQFGQCFIERELRQQRCKYADSQEGLLKAKAI